MCCAIYAGNIEVLPINSNSEPDFKSHLPASHLRARGDGAGRFFLFGLEGLASRESGSQGAAAQLHF